mmetsp:Transcript_112645/g.251436  ORF Transcript_112645/g.251436 Transcript_112645/m.251436 type:complete len:88 (+) Transcript_112645:48-311(+)
MMRWEPQQAAPNRLVPCRPASPALAPRAPGVVGPVVAAQPPAVAAGRGKDAERTAVRGEAAELRERRHLQGGARVALPQPLGGIIRG